MPCPIASAPGAVTASSRRSPRRSARRRPRRCSPRDARSTGCPRISNVFGACASSHASPTCAGVTPSSRAISRTTSLSATLGKPGNDDPSGKNGTQAMSSALQSVEHRPPASGRAGCRRSAHRRCPAGSARRSDVERHAADTDRADLALVAQRDHLGQLVVDVDDLITLGVQPGPRSRRRRLTTGM